jgi:Holliday junction resolvase RusA-like endonuclease
MKTIDACNLIVWIDDSQIVRSTITKRYGDTPGVWISVRPAQSTEGIFG